MAKGKAAVTAADIEAQRNLPVQVTWPGGMVSKHAIGRITISSLLWANVEWSWKRECWCIEDCEGRCLLHEENLRGTEASAEAAEALATRMIREGSMPVEAAERQRRREQRSRQPAEIRRHEVQEQKYKLLRAQSDANGLERQQPPLYEALAEALDFSDPDLWRSNSFASLRPRLAIYLRAKVADLEYRVNDLVAEHASKWRTERLKEAEAKLARAREILGWLEGEPHARQAQAAE
jgi:hypothetical protein